MHVVAAVEMGPPVGVEPPGLQVDLVGAEAAAHVAVGAVGAVAEREVDLVGTGDAAPAAEQLGPVAGEEVGPPLGGGSGLGRVDDNPVEAAQPSHHLPVEEGGLAMSLALPWAC